MKTGYFYQLKNNIIPGAVSIAVGKPSYVTIHKELRSLAPPWILLNAYRNGEITEAQYTEVFSEQLLKLNPKTILDELELIASDDELVIMCHCGSKSFCHRHLVAEWLQSNMHVEIEEYGVGHVKRENGKIKYD